MLNVKVKPLNGLNVQPAQSKHKGGSFATTVTQKEPSEAHTSRSTVGNRPACLATAVHALIFLKNANNLKVKGTEIRSTF